MKDRKAGGKIRKRRGISLWERYLTKEIEIEFKACLYFFALLFLYSVYQLIQRELEVRILFLAEMILTTYAMGYVQMFLLGGFDEAESYGKKEILYSLLCSTIYTIIAHVCGWFEDRPLWLLVFFLYTELLYVCAFLLYKVKRSIDTKLLNEELKAFQSKTVRERDTEEEMQRLVENKPMGEMSDEVGN